jgi:hypothetical protein
MEEGTQQEREPLQLAAEPTRGKDSSVPKLEEVTVLKEDDGSRPSTSGRGAPTINWGEKRMSPQDLEVKCLLQRRLMQDHAWLFPLSLCDG